MICKAFALTGRAALAQNKTQGVALGYELLPLQGVLLLRASAGCRSVRPVSVGSGRAASKNFCPLPFPSAGDRWFWA